MTAPRRRGWTLALFAAFVLVPILEVWVLVLAGRNIGVLPTLGLLLASALVGTWLSKREGARAWRALKRASAAGGVPARELTDGALVLVGGVLLALPGFVTDVVGLVCLLPITRALPRRVLVSVLEAKTLGLVTRTRTMRGDDVIKGETVPTPSSPTGSDQEPPALEGRLIV